MLPSISQLLVLLVIFVVAVLPPVMVVASKRVEGWAKFGWFIAACFFSWIAYILFVLFTRKDPDNPVG